MNHEANYLSIHCGTHCLIQVIKNAEIGDRATVLEYKPVHETSRLLADSLLLPQNERNNEKAPSLGALTYTLPQSAQQLSFKAL